jgi:PAS domain S-box-containing protein
MIETTPPLHILLVENNENERLLFRRAFQKSGISCKIVECTSAEQAMEQLGFEAPSFDVVVVDYNLTDIPGLELCRKLLDEKVPLPLVLLAETGCEQHVGEALKAGVRHYIIKDPEQGYLELLPMSLITTVHQYNDRRHYEHIEKMIQNKKRIADTFWESIPDTAGLIDTDENVLMVNKAAAESLGRSVDEIIGKNAREILSGDVYELRRSKWNQVIRTGKIYYFEDERDGKYFETWFCPVFDEKGKVESVAVFAHNITDHKKTEKALRQSEEKFRLAMEVTNDALWDWNMVTNEVYRNPRHATMLGYEPHELTASQDEWEKRIHPDDRQALFQVINEHIAGKRDTIEIEYRLRTKSGDYVWALGRGKVVEYNNDGLPVRMVGTNMDITERKRAEEARMEYQTLIRGIMDNAGSIVVVRNIQGQYLMVNREVEKVLGVESDQIIGKTPYDIHSKDKANKILTDDKRVIESRSLLKIEDQLDVKSETRIFLGTKFPLLNAAGEIYAVCTFATDITELKRAEEEVRKFKTIADKAGHGVAMADLQGNLVYVNNSFANMHQYSADELIGKNLSIFHNDEQIAHVNQLNDQLIQKGSYVAEEIWHKKRDNTVFPTLMSATLVRDDNGEPLFMAATATDIKKHKMAEEALKESELRYHTLFEILPVGVGLSTLEGRIIDVNSTFQQMLGYSIEEIGRISVLDTYYNPAERPPILKRLQQDGSVRGFEVQLKRKNGTIFLAYLNVTITKMRGEPVIVTVFRDITEQRRMERALAESEEKYRTLVECAGDPIFTINDKGAFLFANKVAAETLGYQPEGLEGKTLWDVFSKETADRQAANVREVIETGQGINIISLTEVQNKYRWYSTTIEPLRDERGRATAALVIARDVDDIKRAQEQIQMLSSAIEGSINGIVIGDVEGNLTFANNSFLKMWGYENPSEVLGKKATQFWKVNDKAAEIEDALRNGNGWIGELTAVRKDGSLFDVQVCQTSIRNEDGTIASLMASFVDITESKQREEELTRYREQMARAEQLASLGTLSATITHQLMQPLTVIRLSIDNALDELEASSSSKTVMRRLKDSVTQVSNITSIIERFRNFARKSSGRTASEVNLKVIAVRIAGLLSESARSASITLRIRNMDDLPCPWMNENDLEQLFFALIGNAIQAADGKKNRQLVISGAVKDKYIELRLSDNCGGIAPENIDKIFEPFFTTKPRGQGTGLGLCIVKDIVSRIGGHVRVESKFGKGTTFIINIPIEKDKIS